MLIKQGGIMADMPDNQLILGKGVNPQDVLEALNLDERWKLARRMGMTELGIVVDPKKPSNGRIVAHWLDPVSPKRFFEKYGRQITQHFRKLGVKMVGKPHLFVNPVRLKKKPNLWVNQNLLVDPTRLKKKSNLMVNPRRLKMKK